VAQLDLANQEGAAASGSAMAPAPTPIKNSAVIRADEQPNVTGNSWHGVSEPTHAIGRTTPRAPGGPHQFRRDQVRTGSSQQQACSTGKLKARPVATSQTAPIQIALEFGPDRLDHIGFP